MVPVAVLGVTAIIRGVRGRPGGGRSKPACSQRASSASAAWVFGGGVDMPGIPPTPSVLLLPFYFWAAARFGVGAVSAALFATAFAASYETQLGHRPFDVLPPAESLMAVQMYLIVMGIPLMCVAGLLDERRAAEAKLQDRLRFEGLLATIASDFVRQPLDSAFKKGLRHIGNSSTATTWASCKWARPAASCTSSGSGAAVRARLW